MTDLDMVKRCADRMNEAGRDHGATDYLRERSPGGEIIDWRDMSVYDPLNDGAQAMALVKKFKLHPMYDDEGSYWTCFCGGATGCAADLNRAIVECVSKMK